MFHVVVIINVFIGSVLREVKTRVLERDLNLVKNGKL